MYSVSQKRTLQTEHIMCKHQFSFKNANSVKGNKNRNTMHSKTTCIIQIFELLKHLDFAIFWDRL